MHYGCSVEIASFFQFILIKVVNPNLTGAMELFGKEIKPARVALVAIIFLSTHAMSEYLQYQPAALMWIVLFITTLLILKDADWPSRLTKFESVVLAIFSGLVSLSILIGKHIVISGSKYTGTAAENYIEQFTLIDFPIFLGITFVVFVFSARLYAWTISPARTEEKVAKNATSASIATLPESLAPPRNSKLTNTFTKDVRYTFKHVSPKDVFICLVVLFIAWLPYLLIYWPGFVFGDTVNPLKQAVAGAPWKNNQPIFFMLLLKMAMHIMEALGFSRTSGLALYSLCQMLCYGGAFAYFINWLRMRFNLRSAFCWIILAVYAFSPYVATYSIAFWKDPLFTSGALLLTLMFADVAFSKCSSGVVTPHFLCLLTITSIFISLMRNNGIYIVFASLFMLLVFWVCIWRHDKNIPRRTLKGISVALFIAIVVAYSITGPLYIFIGVRPTEMVESVGIPLNQMARVAAVSGEMTESDKAYLDSVLPLEQYAEKYRPCCTDMLKWDSEFNDEALETGDFWAHWWSMLLKNPKEYLKAWIMQTFGFWTFNENDLINYQTNIAGGNLRQPDALSQLNIKLPDYRADTQLHRFFPYDDHSIPEGLIFWILFYLAIVLMLTRKWTWLLALVPSGALMLTLFIASPIWYWARYACLIQFLLPLYITIFCALRNR